MILDNVPVIVGVGQFVERIDDPAYRGLSPADIAAQAGSAAIADAGGDASVAARIGAVGGIRTFEDTLAAPAPFGKAEKYPLAVARRLGLAPRIAILEKAGGQSPLTLLCDLGERIAAGKIEAALAFGSEAISSVRHLTRAGEQRDWNEPDDGEVEDHGRGLADIIMRQNVTHGLAGAPAGYALLENARRARLKLSTGDYARKMGELFAPFSAVAAGNPYAAAAVETLSADEIATPSERNRMVAEPYTVKLVSRDQVNQGAAVLLMSAGAARAAGIPQHRWIFLHAAALGSEHEILERDALGECRAVRATLDAVLAQTGKSADDVALFDFYSCFPAPVFTAAVDTLGLAPDDPRGLTVTGGLPYFGGPGNNYSMHAIATMSERLRARPGSFGLVGLNGGFMSKYGAMILSGEPAPWPACTTAEVQAVIDEAPRRRVARAPEGWGAIVTYTIAHGKTGPTQAIIIGELDSGERFVANEADAATLAEMSAQEPIGRRVYVTPRAEGNRFAFDRAAIRRAYPPVSPAFEDRYDAIFIERRGHILEITLNRPEQRNSLPGAAHRELERIFDAYEADPDLWVAIITGAGDRAFCAGMDLKNTKSDGVLPPSGFGGITSRRRTKPVIAAVNGIAFGGGMEICLACDMVVADPSARFGLSEVRVGVIAGAGGAVRLQRQIPRKIAMELLLTGRAMDVDEARSLGLINRVSEPGEVLAEARRLAQEIERVSPTSVRLTMQMIQESDAHAGEQEAAAAAIHSTALDRLLVSDDMIEGVTAFAQKRPPRWRNH